MVKLHPDYSPFGGFLLLSNPVFGFLVWSFLAHVGEMDMPRQDAEAIKHP